MANSKAIGVAYADPAFDSVSVSGPLTAATVTTSGDAAASNAVAGMYFYSTAIAANTTTTTAPKGSFGMTSNATGLGKLFYSDGAKWQLGAIT